MRNCFYGKRYPGNGRIVRYRSNETLCRKNEDGSLTIPKERVDWWNKEIETKYADLSEKLKEYDREEVRKTLNAIIRYIAGGFNENT